MPPDSPSDICASPVPRVLVADDEPGLVRGLRRQLERGGYAVLEASDVALVRAQLAQVSLGESGGIRDEIGARPDTLE